MECLVLCVVLSERGASDIQVDSAASRADHISDALMLINSLVDTGQARVDLTDSSDCGTERSVCSQGVTRGHAAQGLRDILGLCRALNHLLNRLLQILAGCRCRLPRPSPTNLH